MILWLKFLIMYDTDPIVDQGLPFVGDKTQTNYQFPKSCNRWDVPVTINHKFMVGSFGEWALSLHWVLCYEISSSFHFLRTNLLIRPLANWWALGQGATYEGLRHFAQLVSWKKGELPLRVMFYFSLYFTYCSYFYFNNPLRFTYKFCISVHVM